MKPLISVIMSVYNDSKNLDSSISSILNQSFKNFELLIMNDGSTENIQKILSKYEKNSKIRIFKNENNIGLTKSLNLLIKESVGKYIARQDSDDISISSRLNKQIDYLNKYNLDLCGTRAIIKQNQLLGSWVAIILKLITKSKLYMRTGYDMYLFSIKNKNGFFKRILYFILTQKTIFFSDIYSVTSSSDLIFLKSRFLNTKKLVKRPNWVDVDLSNNTFEKNKILAVGRLENQKNFKELISESAGTGFEINIYGEGSKKNDLLNQAIELDVKIKIFNNVENSELLDIYKNYKYFVSTANFEGNSKVILEAMSRGCIVIAKDIENNREIIKHMESGLLFKENLNEILKNCKENQYDNLNFIENAIEVITKDYNFEKIFSNYISDFNLLLKTD